MAEKVKPVEIPEWVTETPEYRYELTMWDQDSAAIQEQDIDLTREEFDYLKQCLAIKRGYIAATSDAFHAEAA